MSPLHLISILPLLLPLTSALTPSRLDFPPLRAPNVPAANYTSYHAHYSTLPRYPNATSALEAANTLFKDVFPEVKLKLLPGTYKDEDTKMWHIYYTQLWPDANGPDKEIENSSGNVNVREVEGEGFRIWSYGQSFAAPMKPAARRSAAAPPLTNAVKALKVVIDELDIPLDTSQAKVGKASLTGGTGSVVIEGVKGELLLDPEENKPVVSRVPWNKNGEVVWSWKVEVDLKANGLTIYKEVNGELLGVQDLVRELGEPKYRVFKFGGPTNPGEGQRTLESGPLVQGASPGGWHQFSASIPIEKNTTVGNNVYAMENWDEDVPISQKKRPSGGVDLAFDFPYNSTADMKGNYNAAATQAFYLTNSLHDYFEALGFGDAVNYEEVSTAGKGNDAVLVELQNSHVQDNAFWRSARDGSSPNLQLGTSLPIEEGDQAPRDSAFDASVVIHEYVHGVTHRLVGGPNNHQGMCILEGVDGGGLSEGFSDFAALALRIKPTDTRNTNYGIAEWFLNAGPGGIRRYPYSTSSETNPTSFDILNNDEYAGEHMSGMVWANVLYGLLWRFIEKKGYIRELRPQFDQGTFGPVPRGGRNYVVKLVLDAMKLMPCAPSMLDARDAIIDAEYALTAGQNLCEIWTAFTLKGMGVNAYIQPDGTRVADYTNFPEC